MITIQGHEIQGRMPAMKRHLRDATRAGRKTETRRVIKNQPPASFEYAGRDTETYYRWEQHSGFETVALWTTRHNYGRAGDVRVMKEPLINVDGFVCYADDNAPVLYEGAGITWKWKIKKLASRFMPTWAGRTLVEYTGIGAEQLHSITSESAENEGIEIEAHDITTFCRDYSPKGTWFQDWDGGGDGLEWPYVDLGKIAQRSFQTLWDSINAKRGCGWDEGNWWLWVIKWKLLHT